MTETVSCPACGAAGGGSFCANCGAALAGTTCGACSKPLTPGARFCHHCGAPTASATVATHRSQRSAVAWLVPGIAVLAVVAFVIGQRVGGGAAVDPASAAQIATAPMTAGAAGPSVANAAGRAPDISSMSPEERATRLFDRVMRYGEEGKMDSARFFAPMAIQAYEMLGTLDAHNRYDIGMIAIVSGDAVVAAAEADTILRANRTHLLGLILGMKAAGLRNDTTARAGFEKRLFAAATAERAKNVKEYVDHKPDIDAALKLAGSPKP